MEIVYEGVAAILIVLGTSFALVGSLGLVRLRGLISRVHAPTKATTLGVGSLLLASMIYFYGLKGAIGINQLLIMVFLFLTAPVSAHFIAKGHLVTRGELPTDSF
jgi:multicomponent K+:H+ antiporter subunit G